MRLSRRKLFMAVGLTVLVPALPAVAASLAGEVRIGDWERYYLGLDGGAHQKALAALGLAHRDGLRADEPDRLLPIGDVVHAAVDHGDHAAADYLRDRLKLDTPSMLRRGLKIVLDEDGLEERYLTDPVLQLRVIGHYPKAKDQAFALPDTVSKAVRAAAA